MSVKSYSHFCRWCVLVGLENINMVARTLYFSIVITVKTATVSVYLLMFLVIHVVYELSGQLSYVTILDGAGGALA